MPGFDIDEYVRSFNAAVERGDWTGVVEHFTDDATLEFVGPPVGPFRGRAAILEAYTRNPPDDTIEIGAPALGDPGELVVPYTWVGTGATGTLSVREHGGRIVRLVVTFD